MTFDPAAIMAAQRPRHDAMGLGVRCPVCNAGIRKFCIGGKDGGIAPSHAERIAAK